MDESKILLDNIDKIHTTKMGIDRIKLRNDSDKIIEYLYGVVFMAPSP